MLKMWPNDVSWKYFLMCSLLLQTYALAIKLKIGRNNLLKNQCAIYRPEYVLRKEDVINLIKSLTNFIYKRVSSMYLSGSHHVKKFA